ncbi:MAG TPA: peptidylprolyl isomerase [Burkholderiaceae bacterium]|nr:peptidylprolyl isomerase [Burkholderiaceae bacterium]
MNASPMTQAAASAMPTVEGVPLAAPDEALSVHDLRSRASIELLRQAAMRAGLLPADDLAPVRGVISEAAANAIESLLERELARPAADDATCRRYHAANTARFAVGEQARLRHVLFAITPGVDVDALRQRAEACLLDVRARRKGDDDRFGVAAAQWSNCPSGREGGELGWLTAAECAPEFASEVFGHPEVGVLPRLVRSRFGFHVVEVLERRAGAVPPYEAVREAVRQTLERQAYATALRQYVQLLAGQARLDGIDLDAASTPLVQ